MGRVAQERSAKPPARAAGSSRSWERLLVPAVILLVAGLWAYTRFEALAPDQHPHRPGMHGGTLLSLGEDRYHVETVLQEGGVLRLFTLGDEESRVLPIARQTPTAYVRAAGRPEAVAIVLQPESQPNDPPGMTSQFAAQLPPEVVAAGEASVTVPLLVVEGQQFRLGFSVGGVAHSGAMPEKVAEAEQRELYLTAGGRYTEADIRANGRMTASEKFRGFQAEHDFRPEPGEVICPVTRTKANNRCTWVIGGEAYQFCCPPCIDEFMKLAKEDPRRVQEPAAYIKQ